MIYRIVTLKTSSRQYPLNYSKTLEMVGPRNNKKEPAQVPGDRGDVSRLNTRSHSVMAQGHNDFSGSRPGSQRNQNVSADDVVSFLSFGTN